MAQTDVLVYTDDTAMAIGLAESITQPAAGRRSVQHPEAYSFLRHPGSFEACPLCAILNSGDWDTLGAMACAVSGRSWGLRASGRPGEGRSRIASTLRGRRATWRRSVGHG